MLEKVKERYGTPKNITITNTHISGIVVDVITKTHRVVVSKDTTMVGEVIFNHVGKTEIVGSTSRRLIPDILYDLTEEDERIIRSLAHYTLAYNGGPVHDNIIVEVPYEGKNNKKVARKVAEAFIAEHKNDVEKLYKSAIYDADNIIHTTEAHLLTRKNNQPPIVLATFNFEHFWKVEKEHV